MDSYPKNAKGRKEGEIQTKKIVKFLLLLLHRQVSASSSFFSWEPSEMDKKLRFKSQSYPGAPPPLDFETTFAELDPGTFSLKGKEGEKERNGNSPFPSFFFFIFFLLLPSSSKKRKGEEREEMEGKEMTGGGKERNGKENKGKEMKGKEKKGTEKERK